MLSKLVLAPALATVLRGLAQTRRAQRLLRGYLKWTDGAAGIVPLHQLDVDDIFVLDGAAAVVYVPLGVELELASHCKASGPGVA